MALKPVRKAIAHVGQTGFEAHPPIGKRARVIVSPGPEAKQWMRHFHCTAHDLSVAVKAVGTDPLDVGVYLERRC